MSDTSERTGAVDAVAAATALNDVSKFERRTREAFAYRECADLNFLWAGITTAGYLGEMILPKWADSVWYALNVLGILGMLGLAGRVASERRDSRPIWVILTVTVFSYFWFALLHDDAITPRDVDAFFPLCYMLGVTVIGLWIGRLISLTAIGVAVLIVAVYLLTPAAWFAPAMVVCVGGGLAVSGLVMRRVGAGE